MLGGSVVCGIYYYSEGKKAGEARVNLASSATQGMGGQKEHGKSLLHNCILLKCVTVERGEGNALRTHLHILLWHILVLKEGQFI